jgi:hypothetical protein
MGAGYRHAGESCLRWGIAKHPSTAEFWGDPKPVSETKQIFQARAYYLCGKYFQRNGIRLHRRVWEVWNGRPVPEGYDVHHKDGRRDHNWHENLELLPKWKHMREHHLGHDRGIPDAAVEAAREWHVSKEGRKWDREHYRQTAAAMHQHAEFTCEQCGTRFTAQVTGSNRFCSNNCKTRFRKASGVDDEKRSCVVCGGSFVANRYDRKETCSLKCRGVLIVRRRGQA